MEPFQLPGNVVLRVLEEGDGPKIAEAVKRNREHLARWDPARSEDYFTADWHNRHLPRQLESLADGDALPLIIADGAHIVGRVDLSRIVRGPLQSAVIGYWIDYAYTGKGLVSAAVAQTIAFARDELGLHRLEAGTMLENFASQAVLRKAGFTEFGLAPRMLLIAGRWEDHRLFQLLLHE